MEQKQEPSRFSLKGRRIIVTGASQGLGRGIALAAIEAGATVIGVARSEAGLAETGAEAATLPGIFEALAAELSTDTDFDALVGRAWSGGAVHGVVHAAGVQVRKPAVEITRDDWRRVTSIQSEVPFFFTTALARRQLEANVRGAHLFIGSLASSIGLPNIAPYSASKAGILGLTRSLAVEWAGSGIRVNALNPGYFHTALTADLLADAGRREKLLGRIPLGRLGVADDIAGAAIFLLSDAAAYITGQAINVDGGWLAG